MSSHTAAIALANQLHQPPPPGSPHGVPIVGTETPGRSAIYRHWAFRDRPLLASLDPSVKTLHDLFESSAKEFPQRPCLGARRWLPDSKSWENKFRWMTYEEVARRRHHFGAGLAEIRQRLGLDASQSGVALWSQNRPEWQIIDLGCMSQGLYTVSLYETLGPDTTEFIMKHAELSTVACSLPHVATLLSLASRLPLLKLIVVLDSLDQGEQDGSTKSSILNELASQSGITIWSLDQVEKLGAELGHPMRPVKPSDLYTINYTSGTTGEPKGVLLTHACALASNCTTVITNPGKMDDVGLSYLPLAHMLQRLVEHAGFAAGASFGYFRGDLALLPEDIKLLQPTTFASVPRLFNRFASAIRASTVDADGIKGALSRSAMDAKLASLQLPIGQATCHHWLYDRIWTPKIRAALGFGRLRVLASGSAPLDPQAQHTLAAALAVPFLQGYGMTETSGLVAAQLEGDFSTGNVGPPMPCAEMCLESIPELEYYVTDKPFPRGELLVRGPAIFAGYLKNDEENSKALGSDGWLHTGDVASIDELGRISIIDRKKNIVKLSQGEYVAPEQIENVYATNTPLIAMAFVHGDSTKSSLVGIFDMNPETFTPFANNILRKKVDAADLEAVGQLAAHPHVKREFLKILDKIGKDNGFAGFQRVRNVLLRVAPFTVENGLLTPTLKLKRAQAAKAFQQDIERLYAEVDESSTGRLKL